jgi:hypothetical protein
MKDQNVLSPRSSLGGTDAVAQLVNGPILDELPNALPCYLSDALIAQGQPSFALVDEERQLVVHIRFAKFEEAKKARHKMGRALARCVNTIAKAEPDTFRANDGHVFGYYEYNTFYIWELLDNAGGTVTTLCFVTKDDARRSYDIARNALADCTEIRCGGFVVGGISH